MAKRKIAPRFFILIAVIVIGLAVALFLLFRSGTYADMSKGTIKFEQTLSTIIVRNETVVKAENYGKIMFNVSEGDSVQANKQIAVLFKWGYKDTIMQDLVSIQSDIMSYQINTILKGTLDVEMTNKNQAILDKLSSIKSVVNGQKDGNLTTLYNDLQTLLAGRETLFKSKVQSSVDSKLSKLYDQESAAIERIEGWETTLNSTGAGIVSFYFDGYEDLLTPSNISKLTLSDIQKVQKNSTTTTSSSDSSVEPIYRLVNGDWYCIFVVENAPSYYFAKGAKFDITFEGYYDKPYTGTVTDVRAIDDKNTLFTVKMNEAIGNLISIRNIKATFKANYDGYVVPTSALKTEDSKVGIYIKSDNANVFVPVEIEMEDNNNAIVKSLDNTSFTEGMKVLVK